MTEWATLSYTPGRWVAVAAASQWLLVDLAAEDPVVRRCWKLMSEQAGVDAVLDALLAAGVASAPGFVLVSLGSGERRVVSRWPASAIVHAGRDDREIGGVEGASWTDVLLGDERPDGVTLRGLSSTAASNVELPMGAGVTTAGTVHITASPSEPRSRPAAPAPLPPVSSSTVLQPLPPHPGPPAVPAVEAVADVADVADEGETETYAGDSPSYDFLFGATMRPEELDPAAGQPHDPPEASVVPGEHEVAPEPPTAPPPTGYTRTLIPAATEVPPPLASPSHPAPSEPTNALIDAVPWLIGRDSGPVKPPVEAPRPVGPQAVVEPPVAPAEVSATVNRAQLRAAAEAAAAPGVKVLAGYCPSRHLSPPHAARCRVCSAPMPQQEPFEITRPPLGVLRLVTGELITLDRGVVLGRSPETPRSDAVDRPHVVRVSSPDNDVSRTHAEIFLDGWNVYVRDFGSVNGTVVNLPGQPPQRLRDNDPHLLENGTVVTLADEFAMTFEVTA